MRWSAAATAGERRDLSREIIGKNGLDEHAVEELRCARVRFTLEGSAADENHRHVRGRGRTPEPLRQAEAVSPGERVIGDDEVWNLGGHVRERRGDRVCKLHAEAVPLETPAIHLARIGIVIDDEDQGRSGHDVKQYTGAPEAAA